MFPQLNGQSLKGVTAADFQEAFASWEIRWQQCINSEEDYFNEFIDRINQLRVSLLYGQILYSLKVMAICVTMEA